MSKELETPKLVISRTYYFCPTCKREIELLTSERLKKCSLCGQRLDWSDEK